MIRARPACAAPVFLRIVMALYSYGRIELWPYIVMAPYSYIWHRLGNDGVAEREGGRAARQVDRDRVAAVPLELGLCSYGPI